MPGVGADIHRQAVGLGLGVGLHGVVPVGSGLGVAHVRQQHMADMILRQELLLLIRQLPNLSPALLEGLAAVGSGEGACGHGGDGLVGAVHHQARNLGDAEPGGQIPGPFLRRQPPVLVGQQLSGALQVLEVQSILLQNRGRGHAQDQALGIFQEAGFHSHSDSPFRFFLLLYHTRPRRRNSFPTNLGLQSRFFVITIGAVNPE